MESADTSDKGQHTNHVNPLADDRNTQGSIPIPDMPENITDSQVYQAAIVNQVKKYLYIFYF